jgi:CRISPR system Cascade subunit CasB
MPPFVFDLYQSRKEAVFIVGALFGLHWQAPAIDRGEPFTTALKLTERSESYEKRIQALLRSDRESLPTHLRHAVTYIKSKGDDRGAAIPVDWVQLIRHIANWDHPDRYVQRRWAEAWWGTRFDRERPDEDSPAAQPVTTSNES